MNLADVRVSPHRYVSLDWFYYVSLRQPSSPRHLSIYITVRSSDHAADSVPCQRKTSRVFGTQRSVAYRHIPTRAALVRRFVPPAFTKVWKQQFFRRYVWKRPHWYCERPHWYEHCHRSSLLSGRQSPCWKYQRSFELLWTELDIHTHKPKFKLTNLATLDFIALPGVKPPEGSAVWSGQISLDQESNSGLVEQSTDNQPMAQWPMMANGWIWWNWSHTWIKVASCPCQNSLLHPAASPTRAPSNHTVALGSCVIQTCMNIIEHHHLI